MKIAQPGKRTGFTLIELLVVIAIIAILAAMLLPVLSRAKDTSKRVLCTNNMKQLGVGLHMYADDYDGICPTYMRNSGCGSPCHSCNIALSAQACDGPIGLGYLWASQIITSKELFWDEPEVAWQEQAGSSSDWWRSISGNYHRTGWPFPAYTGGRWNSSYMYRFAAPGNPYGHLQYPGHGWLNCQGDAEKDIAERAFRDGEFNDKGILTENMLSNDNSPANANGTCHQRGGNALYFDGHVLFIQGLCNPYNPGPGPLGYYVGYRVFHDFIDGK